METHAPGLTADWLNGWLAAVGVTVLLPGTRLKWSADGVPHAVFLTAAGDLAGSIAGALPTVEDLQRLAIAREHPQSQARLQRNVTLAIYRDRAELTRRTGDWSLASTLTDLGSDSEDKEAQHSPFDPPAPRGETLHDRVVRCRAALGADEVKRVGDSLRGTASRIKANGLGFDYRRLSASGDDSATFVDPVVELLAFHGLALYPIRGNGRRARTRGWTTNPSRTGAFTWPVWQEPLDHWAIDALLDGFYAKVPGLPRLTVAGAFQSVYYVPKATADVTRAYAAERIG